jgi:hypothetical protein
VHSSFLRSARFAGSVANRLKGALSGLIGSVRALYLCGLQQLQQVRKRFKNTIFNTYTFPAETGSKTSKPLTKAQLFVKLFLFILFI